MKALVEELRLAASSSAGSLAEGSDPLLAALAGGQRRIAGGPGDDVLIGTDGKDKIRGHEGDDVLIGGAGNDKLFGGEGSDTFVFEAGFGRDVIKDIGDGDTLRFDGIDEADLVHSRHGKHLHIEIDGTDDRVVVKNYFKGEHDVTLAWDGGSASGLEGSGETAAEPPKLQKLGRGDDSFVGDAGPDRVKGGKGDDVLQGDDVLFVEPGLSHDDILSGDKGDDVLIGGAGDDVLEGGRGHDTFVFRVQEFYEQSYAGPDVLASRLADGADLILDFERGTDRIDLQKIDVINRPATLTSGNFEVLDGNGDGVLDERDPSVSLENVTHDGRTETSLVLDVGAAFGVDAEAAGYAGTYPYTPGPHTLTVLGVTSLDAADFVPTETSDLMP